MGEAESGLQWTTVALFSLLEVFVLFMFGLHVRTRLLVSQEEAPTPPVCFPHSPICLLVSPVLKLRVVFFALCTSFVALRIAWASLEATGASRNPIFIVQRTALSLYLSLLTIVLAFGMRRYYGGGSDRAKAILKNWQWGLIVLNVLVYVFLIGIFIALGTTGDESIATEGHPLFETHILAVVIVMLLLGLVFLYYGWRMWMVIRNSGDDSTKSKQRSVQIAWMTGILAVCFLTRVVLFVWRPISGGELVHTGAWYPLAYWVPEIVPITLQTIYVQSSASGKSKHVRAMDVLYSRHEESYSGHDEVDVEASDHGSSFQSVQL